MFGVSTHLFHEQKLAAEHLAEVGRRGYGAVELFATRSHFDYHDPQAIESLREWLDAAGLPLTSVHAPITDAFAGGKVQRNYSTAFRDAERRQATLAEMTAALRIADVVPFRHFVVHLGVPSAQRPGADDNHRDAATRSVEDICRLAEPHGVTVALEVMDNPLSTPEALVDLIEHDFDGAAVGICLDVGHAHMLGDTAEAVETVSEYLVTTHVHDNRRRSDDHLVPFEGSINWSATVMAFQKIGYDGVLMYEVRDVDSPRAVLDRAAAATRRLEDLMSHGWADFG